MTHGTHVTLRIKNHKETIWLLVTDLGRHDIILGWNWIKQHEILMDYRNQSIKFTAGQCSRQCLTEQKPENSGHKQLLMTPNSPAEQVDCSLDLSSQTAVSLSTPAPQSPQQRLRRCPKPTKPEPRLEPRPEKPKNLEPLDRRFHHQ